MFRPNFKKHFEELDTLGKSDNAIVFKCRSQMDHNVYAIKVIDKKNESEKCWREFEALKELDHANIVNFVDCWVELSPRPRVFIQMELCDLDLAEWFLDNPHPRDRKQMIRYFHQTATALEYLHSRDYMHRDIKPQNIFLLGDVVKLGDFGLVKEITIKGAHHTSDVGTAQYMSPELEENRPDYNNKIDIYALGLTFFEMINPLDYKNLTQQYRALNAAREFVMPHFTPDMMSERQLITRMLQVQPEDRPSAADILGDKLFEAL